MARPRVLPSATVTASAPGTEYTFRGSMAGLHAPLSTLRRAPRDALRMTRGQHDSLRLGCQGLSPFTPCRSPGALLYEHTATIRGDVLLADALADCGASP